MPKYTHHIFVCQNERPPDNPKGCCLHKGSDKILDFFKANVHALGLKKTVRANKAGCLDQCAFGPSVVVYPEGVWYTVPTVEDAKEILDRHILKGEVVTRLLMKGSDRPNESRDRSGGPSST